MKLIAGMLAWSLGLGAVVGGCVPSAAPKTVAVDGNVVHPADALEAAARLPSRTLAFVVSDGIEAFAHAIGRDEIRRRFLEGWEQASFELVREMGWDLLDPEAIAEVGVDIHAPVGVALLPGRYEPVAVVFVSLSQPARFKKELYRVLGDSQRHRPRVAAGKLVVGANDGAVLLDGDLAMVVMGDDAKERAMALARLPVEDSLSRKRAFRVALRQQPTATLRGYLDVRGLAYMTMGMDPRWAGETTEQAFGDIERAQREALASARTRGESVEEIVARDDGFARAREQLQQSPDASAMRALFGGVHGAGFGLTIRHDGLDLRLALDTAEQGPWRKLLVNRSGVAPILRWVDRTPSLMLALSLDVSELVGLVRQLGGELAEEAVRSELDVDLERDVAEVFTGELGLALMFPKAGLRGLRQISDFGVVGHLGLKDPKAAMALLGRLSEHRDVRRHLERDGDELQLRAGELGAITVAVRGKQLMFSTDGSQLKLPKTTADASKENSAMALVRQGQSAADGFMQLALPMSMLVAMPSKYPMVSAVHPWHDPALPKSAAYEAKLAELQAVDRQIEEQYEAASDAAMRRLVGLLEPLGAVAMRVHETDAGLELEAMVRTGGEGMVSVVADALLGLRQQEMDAAHEVELAALYVKRNELDQQLEEIYARDAQSKTIPDMLRDGATEAP